MNPSVAVIIPVGSPFDQVEKCLDHCVKSSYTNRTIAVVTDGKYDTSRWPEVVNVVVERGRRTGPAEKRDFAMQALPAHDVYAYLDADAYPAEDWLTNAMRALEEHPEAAGVGGPGIMPPDQTNVEALSAACTESPLGGGPLRFRFWPTRAQYCDDYPAYNLFLRREDLLAVGGWASDFYSGEDTLLCENIAKRGRLIYYDPTILIYHYRRAIIPGHWKQNFNVGRSRGTFVREGSERSKKVTFFAPLVGILMVLAFIVTGILVPGMRIPFAALSLCAYALAVAFGHPGPLRLPVRLLLPLGLFLHHLAYASGFSTGLIAKGRRRVGSRPAAQA